MLISLLTSENPVIVYHAQPHSMIVYNIRLLKVCMCIDCVSESFLVPFNGTRGCFLSLHGGLNKITIFQRDIWCSFNIRIFRQNGLLKITLYAKAIKPFPLITWTIFPLLWNHSRMCDSNFIISMRLRIIITTVDVRKNSPNISKYPACKTRYETFQDLCRKVPIFSK